MAMWDRSNVPCEQLQDWCRRAELSGIDAFAEFSFHLR
jgi:stearoyl-CoA desaturase (delta-9 desaturase)